MMCEDPNTSNRTIHLTSQEQANDAAVYHCMPGGDPAKGHLMTSVNTEGYVTVWFSPKQIFRNVAKVCWDQNITDLGGGKWTTVNFLTAAEYGGKADLGYTSPDFPKSGGPSSPQGAAANGVKVFRGDMNSYTDSKIPRRRAWRQGIRQGGALSALRDRQWQRNAHDHDGAAGRQDRLARRRRQHPQGDIRLEFADDSYNPDKHFDAKGAPPNSSNLYTWHWDNIEIYTAK